MRAALAEGPVLLVMWHSRCLMAQEHWPISDGILSTLHNNSPVGRLAGALHRRVGMQPFEMSRKHSNRVVSRTVLKRLKDGFSIGLTGDGPLGPALQLKDPPLEWARVTGLPVFCYAFSTSRGRRMNSWDRMLVPRPFGKGSCVFRRFPGKATRRMEPEAVAQMREELRAFMIATNAEADALAGVPPGP